MKKGFNILLILCAALVAISCSKTKSYTDMLKDEKKAIERFIDDKGLEILDDFPADSVFKENQFVLLDNGVYLNIIDKGSDQRAVQYNRRPEQWMADPGCGYTVQTDVQLWMRDKLVEAIDIVPFGYADTLRGQAETEENEAYE